MTTVALSATTNISLSGVASMAMLASNIVLPANLIALATFWETIPAAMTTADKLRFVNTTMVPGPAVDVPRVTLRAVLGDAHATVRVYASDGGNQSARMACNYLLALIDYETFSPNIQTSDPTIQALVQQITPDLLADPATGITSADISAMMALITPLVPWWQMNGFIEPVNVQNLIQAGYLY